MPSVKCLTAISKDGCPMDSQILVTGINKNIKLDIFASLDLGPSHLITLQLDEKQATDLAYEIFQWL